jgi:ComF family protein
MPTIIITFLMNERTPAIEHQPFVKERVYIRNKMNTFFRTELWPALLDILFPLSCLGCATGLQGRQEIAYCITCLQDVRLLREPFCTTCGKPFDGAAGENHLCSYCLKNAWHFKKARAVVRYQPPVTEAIKMFKYQGKMHGLVTFAALTRQYFRHQPHQLPDLIIPVPLHVKRLRQRGFNQALILCKKLFPHYKNNIAPHVLERHIGTQPQTGLNGAERCRNVKNAFMVRRPEKVKNKRILLVDDVFTTGATVNECARILLRSQASEVNVFTFARAIN